MRIGRSFFSVFCGLFAAIHLMACSGENNDSGLDTVFTAKIGMICVMGNVQGNNGIISADTPVHIILYPKGCFSSSCTEKLKTSCAVTGDSTLTVNGVFRLRSTGDSACTPDCSGGGSTACESQNLSPGAHTATAGDLKVSFTVPSIIPGGGICAGSPF